MSTVIQVENLGKRYSLTHRAAPYATLRDTIVNAVRTFGRKKPRSTEEFWALRDVSFDVEQGDRLGVIGRNGAGKSTLLKLLSRITSPTTGRITLDGRVASLLEVGTGFHQELTGRENIFLNGAILGMSRTEIRAKFDEIVAFAEIEKFLDTPVKRYSSGMYVRLAFAVAAHLEPEILVVDEVLAVGDAEFQKRCLGKMDDISKSQGRTLLFVSHNMGAIQQLCNKAIVLSAGSIAFSGKTENAVETYLDKHATSGPTLSKDRSKLGDENVFVEASTTGKDGKPATEFSHDGDIGLGFELHLPRWNPALTVSLSPLDRHRRRIFTIEIPLAEYYTGDPTVKLSVSIAGGTLAPGDYSWTLYIHTPLTTLHDHNEGVCDFSILETGSVYAKYVGHDYGCVIPPKFRVERGAP